jgi:hypothetical protein
MSTLIFESGYLEQILDSLANSAMLPLKFRQGVGLFHQLNVRSCNRLGEIETISHIIDTCRSKGVYGSFYFTLEGNIIYAC